MLASIVVLGSCSSFVRGQHSGSPFFHLRFSSKENYGSVKNDDNPYQKCDELAKSLNDIFGRISTMIKSELQGTNNHLELLEKMNLRVAEEYKGFDDLASGLTVFVEQLICKSCSFDEYVEQINGIEKQVFEFEAVVSMLDKYTPLLESRVQSAY